MAPSYIEPTCIRRSVFTEITELATYVPIAVAQIMSYAHYSGYACHNDAQ